MSAEGGGAGVAPRPETITTSCLLCSKKLVWHNDGRSLGNTAYDYCSTWCHAGHTLLRNLHAELARGRRRIDDAIDRASADAQYACEQGEEPEKYGEENARDAQIAANVKELVLIAYNGIRHLDNMRFYSWGESNGQH